MTINLEAMELLRQQKAKYCRYIDTKQFEKWGKLFKADAKVIFYNVDNSVMIEFGSIAELLGLTSTVFATAQTFHHTQNSEIEFQSDTQATVIWSMQDYHVYAPEGDSPSKTLHGYGFYYETWELMDGEWKIGSLELRRNIVLLGEL